MHVKSKTLVKAYSKLSEISTQYAEFAEQTAARSFYDNSPTLVLCERIAELYEKSNLAALLKAKIKNGDKTYLQDINQIRKTYSLLGIFKRNAKEFLSKMRNEENTPAVEDSIPSEVLELVEKRKQAKLNRDYALADSLRDEITKSGYAVTDTKDGVKIEKI